MISRPPFRVALLARRLTAVFQLPIWLIVAFFCFRVLDIVKPFPARQAQSLAGGFGVMVDDLIAGAYTLLLVAVSRAVFGWPQ